MLTIFDPSFWFDVTPVRMGQAFEIGFFTLFSLCLLLGAALRIARRNLVADRFLKQLLERGAGLAIAAGVTGFIWLFLSFEEIRIFGARFWFLLWVGIVAWRGYMLWKFWYREVPVARQHTLAQQEQKKYLPRRAR